MRRGSFWHWKQHVPAERQESWCFPGNALVPRARAGERAGPEGTGSVGGQPRPRAGWLPWLCLAWAPLEIFLPPEAQWLLGAGLARLGSGRWMSFVEEAGGPW